MRTRLAIALLALLSAAAPAGAALTSNGLFDKGTALSETHVEVVGIELPLAAH